MSRALRLLRQNDPQRTEIHIYLDYENDDATIAQALEQNQYVSRVRLWPAARNAGWDHLCCVLATRANLVFFGLSNYYSERFPAERIFRILQAISQNSAVRVVELAGHTLVAEDLCSFLDASVHVADLMLDRCDFTGGEHGVRNVAAALQRNTNIGTLKLLIIGNFLGTVLEGLVSNTCVRNLVIQHHSLSETTSNVIKGLLESSTGSIQHLELIGNQFLERSFRPIAQGLINGRTVTHITLDHCHFHDLKSRSKSFERHSGTKAELELPGHQGCAVPFRVGSSSSKRCFRLFADRFSSTSPPILCRFANQSFSSLCKAVAESKLESFSIGEVLIT